MGVFDDEQGCFTRKSDPTAYTEISDQAKVNIAADVSMADTYNIYTPNLSDLNKLNLTIDLSVVQDVKRIKTQPFGTQANGENGSSKSEIIYSDAEGLTFSFELPSCLDMEMINPDYTDQDIWRDSNGNYPAGHLEKGTYVFETALNCMNGGIYCSNNHDITVTVSGDNFEPVSYVVKNINMVDMADKILKEKAMGMLNTFKNDYQEDIQSKAGSYISNNANKTVSDKAKKDVYENINILYLYGKTPDENKDLVDKIMKQTIIDCIMEQSNLEDIKLDGNQTETIQSVGRMALNTIKNKPMKVKIDGKEYNVTIKGIVPPKVNGESIPTATIQYETYEAVCSVGKDQINKFAEGLGKYYNELFIEAMEDWKEECMNAAKEIVNAGGLLDIIDKYENTIFEKIGIDIPIDLYKKTTTMYKQVTSALSGNEDANLSGLEKDIDNYIKEGEKLPSNMISNLTWEGFKKLMDNLFEVDQIHNKN